MSVFISVTVRGRQCTFLSFQDFAVFSFTQLLGDTLRELDLTSCVNVTDLTVCSIVTYLQKLVILRLAWCKEVTDWGLLGMVETTKGDPHHETVSLCGGWKEVTGTGVFMLKHCTVVFILCDRETRVQDSLGLSVSWAFSDPLMWRLMSDPS